MFADYVGHTIDAEHQRQQQWHIYIVSGMLGLPCAMPAKFGASAAEVR